MKNKQKGKKQEEGALKSHTDQREAVEASGDQECLQRSDEEFILKKQSSGSAPGHKVGLLLSSTLHTLSSQVKLRDFIFFHSIVSIAIYITMIEGLGKGVKYSLFVANAIIFMGGVIVFSIGVWTLNDRSFMERLLGTNLYVASAAILIVTGSIVSIISFLGTFGAYKEVKCMLLTYFVILVILFIVMVTAGILGYVFRLEVDDRMQQEMHSTIKLYGNDTQVTQAWDAVQAHFECCGITVRPARGYELWRKENVHFRAEGGPVVPESCCRSQEDDPIKKSCQSRQPRREDTYYEGCYERMKEFVKSHALLVGGMAIGVSCLIIFGIILSCALYMMIK